MSAKCRVEKPNYSITTKEYMVQHIKYTASRSMHKHSCLCCARKLEKKSIRRAPKAESFGRTVVMEQLFDEIDVREDHAPTAISFQLELVKRIAVDAKLSWV